MSGVNTKVREQLAKYIETLKEDTQLQALAGYNELISCLQELNRQTDSFYQMDGSGKMTLLDPASYTALMAAYRDAEAACRALSGVGIDENVLTPVNAVAELLRTDMADLANVTFDADRPVYLPLALDRSRGYQVDLTGAKPDAVGGAMSSRKKLSVTDRTGRTIDGYYTEDETIDYIRDLSATFTEFHATLQELAERKKAEKQRLIDEANSTNSTPVASTIRQLDYDIATISNVAARIDSFTDPAGAAELLKPPLAADFWNNSTLAKAKTLPPFIKITDQLPKMGEAWWYLGLTEDEYSAFDKYCQNRGFFEPVGIALREARAAFCKKLSGISIQHAFYDDMMKIPEKSNISRRNCAFSTLANLLGAAEVVASSAPLEIVDGSTRRTGVFMENARGITLSDIPYGHPVGNRGADDLVSPEAMKQLASLQLLDYLGLNIDRHFGNISYVFDDAGRLTGVQGFDNDSSFSTLTPKAGDKFHVLAALDNITVIPRGIADALKGITPEMLRIALRGSLKPEEIDAVYARVGNVLGRLREQGDRVLENGTPKATPGTISVIEDAEWSKMKLTQLAHLTPAEAKKYDLPEKPLSLDPANDAIQRINTGKAPGEQYRPTKVMLRPDDADTVQKLITEKHGGYACKNIFETVMLLPPAQRLDNYAHHIEKLDLIPPDEKRVFMNDAGKRVQLDKELLDAAALKQGKDALAGEHKGFTGVKPVQELPGINAPELRSVIEQANGIFRADHVGGKAAYTAMKRTVADFVKQPIRPINLDSAGEYRKQLISLRDAAQAYLDYKVDPQKPREHTRVEQARRIVDAMKPAIDILTDYLNKEHERANYALLDKANGMARTIDRFDALYRRHMNGEQPKAGEEYLAGYAKLGVDGLNTVIELSMKKELSAEDTEKARIALASMTLAYQAEYAFERRDGSDQALAQNSATEQAREQIVRKVAENTTFGKVIGTLTPERLAEIASSPRKAQELAANLHKADRVGQAQKAAARRRQHRMPTSSLFKS